MNNKLVNFIIKGYLRYDKKNPFISISAILAFLGVAVGVMVLIISMAIMNGTAKEFESKLFTMNYPITIYPKVDGMIDNKLLNKLEKKFPNMIFSPYIQAQAIASKSDYMSGAVIFGVDPQKEASINNIYKEAIKDIDLHKYDIIVGQGIKDTLYIHNGQKLTLYFTSITPNGFSMLPKMKRFRLKGSFKSGLTAYDKAYMYSSLEALQLLTNKKKNEYDGIHIYTKDAFADIKKIEDFLPAYVGVIGWWQQNGNFFSAMQMEKKALFIVLMLIILVASLNIISSLLMTVMSRRKEIALLLSQGMSADEIKTIFLRLGLIIGFSGIVVGVILGIGGNYILSHFDIITLPADVYGTSKLPIDLETIDFAMIIFGSALIVYLSSFYPAKKASTIDVLEVLRNE